MSHRSTNEWYVAKNGNNGNNGGPTSPFLTVQHAITQAQAVVVGTSTLQTIFIAPGNYVENLTIATGYIRLCGTPPGSGLVQPDLPTGGSAGCDTVIMSLNQAQPTINLNVTTAVPGATANTRKIILDGLSLQNTAAGTNGAAIQVASTTSQPFTLIVQNCSLLAPGRIVSLSPSAPAAQSVAIFNQCTFQQSVTATVFSTPLIECSNGGLQMQLCNVTATQNASLVAISGTGQLQQCRLNNFFSGTAETAAAPIVSITSVSVYATPASSCVFAYTVTPSSTRPATSAAIDFSSGAAQAAVLTNNLFLLQGTTANANFAIYTSTPSAAHAIYAAGNYSIAGLAHLSRASLQGMTPIINA